MAFFNSCGRPVGSKALNGVMILDTVEIPVGNSSQMYKLPGLKSMFAKKMAIRLLLGRTQVPKLFPVMLLCLRKILSI